MKQFFSSLAHAVTIFFCAKIITCMPISLKIGAEMPLAWLLHAVSPYFSLYNSAKPLIGAFGGITGSVALCGLTLLSSLLLKGSSVFSLSFLAFHIPGFCASLYWATTHWIVRLVLPIACIGLFVAHPVGGAAWLYSMLWLVPVLLFVRSKQSLFETALAATFVAHAVGSVIWLYTTVSTASMWIGLIPVAAAERVLFAAGMVVLYHAYSKVLEFVAKGYQLLRTRFAHLFAA